MQKLCAVLLTSLSLSGCISSSVPSQTFYYLLDSHAPIIEESATTILNTAGANTSIASKTPIKVLPINLPDYLNQPNLVLKLSNHQVKIAHYHFWAEDLGQSIQRILINELGQLDNTATYSTRCTRCHQLAIYIDHFYPNEQGEVLLSGSYEKLNQQKVLQQVRFSFVKKLNDGGYDESVAVMRALLKDLAYAIKQDTKI